MTQTGSGPLALLGASAKTPWAYWVLRNLRLYGYPGEIWPVSKSSDSFGGLATYPSVAELPGAPAIGVIMLPAEPAADAVDALLAQGASTIVVVANGFAETGTARGAELQERIVAACEAAGARLIGPNCVGFASYHEQICVIAEPVPADTAPGVASVASMSGALLSGVLASLQHRGLGIDQAYSLGNGAQIGLAESIRLLVERPTTQVVCAVVEGIDDPAAVEASLRCARELGKPVVVLRLGSSDQAKGLAASHTGAVVGETRLLDEWLTARGVIVTDEIEELSEVAALSLRLQEVRADAGAGGVFVVTGSGGAAGLAADHAARYGMPLASVQPETLTAIAANLGAGAHVSNPLDMVGGAPAARRHIYSAVAADPAVSVIIEPVAVMWPDDSEGRVWHRENMEMLAEIAAEHGVVTIFASTFHQERSDYVTRVASQTGLVLSDSLELTARALGRLLPSAVRPPAVEHAARAETGVLGEAEGRPLLEALGLPIAVGVEVCGVEPLLAAAATMTPPFVLKTAARDVTHKAAVGGVRVGLRHDKDLQAAATEMEISVGRLHPGEEARRFLLQEMVQGPELLVTLLRDPVAGPVLVVGVGGWAAELSAPLLTCPLPIRDAELLDAIRGSGVSRAVADEQSAAELVSLLHTLGQAFLPGGSLESCSFVECNPVILTADGPRMVDVLLGGAVNHTKGTAR